MAGDRPSGEYAIKKNVKLDPFSRQAGLRSSEALGPLADEVLARCDEVARFSEEVGRTTRTFLCEPMKRLQRRLAGWMEAAGMNVRIDPAANLIGRYEGERDGARVFAIGSPRCPTPGSTTASSASCSASRRSGC
jgi:hypothetical protein